MSRETSEPDDTDWKRARTGIKLVLNNNYAEAQSLFENRENSVQLTAGYAFVVFMNALMTFEEESLEKASRALKELESVCANNIGWFSAVKNKVFGRPNDLGPYEILEQQITLADCQVCQAILLMLTHDSTTGFMKGGWALKKAWGMYHSAFNELSSQYKKCFGIAAEIPGGATLDLTTQLSSFQSPSQLTPNSPVSKADLSTGSPASPTEPINGIRKQIYRLFSPVATPSICADEVNRLARAVSFGYGLFHLCVSLLPPGILKLIQILGFSGNRKIGLEALLFARLGPDMRAPLATLGLLWYHTIINPMFTLDLEEIDNGVIVAERLLIETPEFASSAIFLFFKGRTHRLKNELSEAITSYSQAVTNSSQRELALLCLHEVGWCRLIQLDFNGAVHAFIQLKDHSRWSKVFYTYLATVCCGCMNEMNHVVQFTQSLRKKPSINTSQLDLIIWNRISYLMPTKKPYFYRLLAYEMLYLWNSLPGNEGLLNIIQDIEKFQLEPSQCENQREPLPHEPMVGITELIKGVCLSKLGKEEEAIENLEIVKVKRNDLVKLYSGRIDSHISVFALYELGIIYSKSQKIDEAKTVFQIALSEYSAYDFEHRVKMKIETALAEISTPPS